jgi:hypothetical protein
MYDIIGDIHGHADKLEILLQKLGYKKEFGVYSHPDKRKVAFVGDFIDRGPKIREALHIVKDMCDSENAIAIMGNHEYNAICFHTPHTQKGGFFRDHNLKEIEQHIETLRQFKYFDSEWADFLDWFKTLPLFFENEDFRMVHACWDNANINWLEKNLKKNEPITPEFLTKAADENSREYHIVEETLKGKERKLPNGLSFADKDGAVREECRIKWWVEESKRKIYNDVLVGCPTEIANEPLPNDSTFPSYTENKLLFFGHYWFEGLPEKTNSKAICLDYSVAKKGHLVAYRLGSTGENLKEGFIY